MNNTVLTGRQIEILRHIRSKRSASDRAIIDEVINGTLSSESIQRLCEMINDEYLMEGVEKDYAPNRYGSELEMLLDVVNRPRTQ